MVITSKFCKSPNQRIKPASLNPLNTGLMEAVMSAEPPDVFSQVSIDQRPGAASLAQLHHTQGGVPWYNHTGLVRWKEQTHVSLLSISVLIVLVILGLITDQAILFFAT